MRIRTAIVALVLVCTLVPAAEAGHGHPCEPLQSLENCGTFDIVRWAAFCAQPQNFTDEHCIGQRALP